MDIIEHLNNPDTPLVRFGSKKMKYLFVLAKYFIGDFKVTYLAFTLPTLFLVKQLSRYPQEKTIDHLAPVP